MAITTVRRARVGVGFSQRKGVIGAHITDPPAIGTLFSKSFDDTFVVMAVMAMVGAAMRLVLRRRTAAQEAEAAALAELEGPVEQDWELLAG